MVSFPKISPNLLLGVGGIIAAVFLVSQIRKAGADVQQALTDIKLPDVVLPSITLPDIKLPEITFPEFKLPEIKFPTLFPEEKPFFDPSKEPSEGLLTQPEILECKCGTEIIQDAQGVVTQKCIKCPDEQPDFTGTTVIQVPEIIPTIGGPARILPEEPIIVTKPIIQPIISLIPDEQVFVGSGLGFIGGTIRENPIDTLSEVLQFFPELTSSQARDFLEEFGTGILPSQVEFIDPDVRNIVGASVGGGLGQAFPIDTTTTPQELKSQELIAAEFTCKQFGLNCDLVDGMMA